jgi:DivIVA domain-containing protein
MLRSEDVVNAPFTQTQFRGGYDERDVDEFLDVIVDQLQRYERGDRSAPVLTLASLGTHHYLNTSLRRGYARPEVEQLIASVAETLGYYEAGGAPLPAPPPPVRQGIGRRLVSWLNNT